MGTPFDEIYDLALTVIDDYKLDYIYSVDPEAFSIHFQGWLVRSVANFDGCITSLEYDLSTRRFLEKLSAKEKDILAKYIALFWWEANTNVATQVNLQLQGRDKKTNSESTNIKEKTVRADKLREKVRQDITDYQLNNFDSFKF